MIAFTFLVLAALSLPEITSVTNAPNDDGSTLLIEFSGAVDAPADAGA